VRVFLADDHPVVLAGIRALILEDPGLKLVAEAQDGITALRETIAEQPDVAVLDLSMPGLNGAEVARQLRAAVPTCQVLVLTVHEDGAYLRQLLDIGGAGYVLKRSATEDLSRAIHLVAAGGVYLDPVMAGRALGRNQSPAPPAPEIDTAVDLSTRENEVLRMTANGHSMKTIALRLGIGAKTVETYKARAMAKLGFRHRSEVIHYASSRGWLGDP
jgi:DNA-binding NarL/FixJ family response regulator